MSKQTIVTGIVLLVLSFFLLTILGCEKSSKHVKEPVTYTIGDPVGDWGYPSPYGMYPRGPGYIQMSFIFDTLVWKDKTGIIPALAEKWEYVKSENAYLFQLRKAVTFHDGYPFTADDVVFTFSYIKEHPWLWVDSRIIKTSQRVNDHMVKVHLSRPFAPFLMNIAGVLPILPKHLWENVTEPERFTEAGATVGTGPFKLVDYNKAQGTYLYEAYKDYYLGRPIVDRIRFLRINPETAPAALKRGEINACSVPPDIMQHMRDQGFTIEEEPPGWVVNLFINHKKEPFRSRNFRHALAYAINKTNIVQIVKKGHAVIGSPGLLPPSKGVWYSAENDCYEYDPAKARGILEDLGYSLGPDGYYQAEGQRLDLELLIASPTEEEFIRTAEMIKKDLEGIGIKIALRSLEAKTADSRIQNWHFDLALGGYGGLGGDPDVLRGVIIEDNFNSARYDQNKELVRLLENQVRQMSQEERIQTVHEIQRIYAEELPSITVYYKKWYWAHDGAVSLYYTPEGLGPGIPVPTNKLCFLEPH